FRTPRPGGPCRLPDRSEPLQTLASVCRGTSRNHHDGRTGGRWHPARLQAEAQLIRSRRRYRAARSAAAHPLRAPVDPCRRPHERQESCVLLRRDHADIFCTSPDGVRGPRAKDWRLVDAAVRTQDFGSYVKQRAAALAGESDRPADAKGVRLTPLNRTIDGAGLHYEYVDVE